MFYIYCYTNRINQHKYVGQTNNLKRRKNEHLSSAYNKKSSTYNCLFHKKIREYGIDNFDFEVLEIIYDDSTDRKLVNQQEKYWIEKKQSFCGTGLGYNMTLGGDGFNVISKLEKFSDTERQVIKEKIKSGINFLDLQFEYDLSPSYLSYINHGKIWYDENEQYPLCKRYFMDEDYDELIDLLINSDLSLTAIAKRLNMGYSTVKKINAGTLRPGLYPNYPIRKSNNRADKIKQLLTNTSFSMQEIADNCNCNVETVRRINIGKTFHDDNITYPLRQPVETMAGQAASTPSIDT